MARGQVERDGHTTAIGVGRGHDTADPGRRVERREAGGEGAPEIPERDRGLDGALGRGGPRDDHHACRACGQLARGVVHHRAHRERCTVRWDDGGSCGPRRSANQRVAHGAREGLVACDGECHAVGAVCCLSPRLELCCRGGNVCAESERLARALGHVRERPVGQRPASERLDLVLDERKRGIVCRDGGQHRNANGVDQGRRARGARKERAQPEAAPSSHRDHVRAIAAAGGRRDSGSDQRGQRDAGHGPALGSDALGADGDGQRAPGIAGARHDRKLRTPLTHRARSGAARGPRSRRAGAAAARHRCREQGQRGDGQRASCHCTTRSAAVRGATWKVKNHVTMPVTDLKWVPTRKSVDRRS